MNLMIPPESPHEVFATTGRYVTEKDSEAAFDSYLATLSDLFSVHKQVRGFLVQPRAMTDQLGVRIDRMLMPTKKLRDAGWKLGPIAVECKKSGVKVGPVIAQAHDYTRCVFEVLPGYQFMPYWVFIFPMCKTHGATESLMAQYRVGRIEDLTYGLRIHAGTRQVLSVKQYGEELYMNDANCGRKAGSR